MDAEKLARWLLLNGFHINPYDLWTFYLQIISFPNTAYKLTPLNKSYGYWMHPFPCMDVSSNVLVSFTHKMHAVLGRGLWHCSCHIPWAPPPLQNKTTCLMVSHQTLRINTSSFFHHSGLQRSFFFFSFFSCIDVSFYFFVQACIYFHLRSLRVHWWEHQGIMDMIIKGNDCISYTDILNI